MALAMGTTAALRGTAGRGGGFAGHRGDLARAGGWPTLAPAMRREQLLRLIEAATPEQLRQVARLVLRLSGYAASRISDGPHDGGSDLRVHDVDGAPLPLAIAVSVEQGWQRKLRDDAAKAKRRLALARLLFISSRRIPEASFRPLQLKLQEELGVQVDRIDQQNIADMVVDGGALMELLQLLDIAVDAAPLPSEPSDRRRDAAFAFAFFSPEVRSFREVVREQSLLVALAQAGGTAKIGNLCADAARLLGTPVDDAARLLPDLERLRKQARVEGFNGSVGLAADERSTQDGLRTLRRREEAELRAQLVAELGLSGLPATDEVVESTLRGLGALMLRHVGAPDALDDLRAQARLLRRALQAHGLPEGARGDQVVAQLLEVARASPLGRSLATGSLYRTLCNLHREALLGALDVRSVALVLDASVAIPMLCSLFHGEVRQRFFVVAHELHRQAQRHRFPLQLPTVWLEEMASHLLKARFYRGLAREGGDELRLSQNAYVAYFVGERRDHRRGDFNKFLASFGLSEAIERRAQGDFEGARRQIELALRRQLAHYGIAIVDTPVRGQHIGQIEKDWDWARHELNIERRDPVLERHDKQVLAWLASLAEDDPAHAPVVVTWDRVVRRARPEGVPGGALDPLAVCELLSFLGGDDAPAETVRFAGLWLTEQEAERGAAILDALVAIERENLSDAELVVKAQEFRAQYLEERRDVSDVTVLEQAWRGFRERRR